MDIIELRQKRDAIRDRKRRILFNDDGWGALNSIDNNSQEYEEELFLYNREKMKRIPSNTQIDTLIFSSMTTGTFSSHISQVDGTTIPTDRIVSRGVEPLKVLRKWCNKNKIELFWSLRMNDVHDGINDSNFSRYACDFKKNNPSFIMGTSTDRVIRGRNYSAFDYTHTEVRRFMFDIVKDVCSRYDIDGIELDFERNPPFFKSFYDGKEVNISERNSMTQLVRDIRTTTENISLKTGKPILLTIRIPNSLDVCFFQGLDIETWLREGLIDFIACGGNIQYKPIRDFVNSIKIIKNIPVYNCLSNAWFDRSERNEISKSWFGRGYQTFKEGCNGIYLFNFFPSTVPFNSELYDEVFNNIGEMETMRYKPKRYYANFENIENWINYIDMGYKDVYAYYFGNSIYHFIDNRISYFNENNPLKITSKIQSVIVPIYDVTDTSITSLTLKLNDITNINNIIVKLNGNTLTNYKLTDNLCEYSNVQNYIVNGNNIIEIFTDINVELNLLDLYFDDIPYIPKVNYIGFIDSNKIQIVDSAIPNSININISTPQGINYIQLVDEGSSKVSNAKVITRDGIKSITKL